MAIKPEQALSFGPGTAVQDFAHATVLSDQISQLAQLGFASTGVMIVSGVDGHWVVPPGRALWLAPNIKHTVRMLGKVSLRSVFVNADSMHGLPQTSCVLALSPLLREIISAAADASLSAVPTRRAALLTELLLEEVRLRPELPLHLPVPHDLRLAIICTHIQTSLDDMTSLQHWASELNCDERTLHRLFVHELGLSFVQWRQRAKLLRALEWLIEGRPVLSIAIDLGYQTQSAFSAMFRRNLGVAPSVFFKNPYSDVPLMNRPPDAQVPRAAPD